MLNRILAVLCRSLEPAERECVRGDLEELRLRTPAAAANVLGLVIRRQLAAWLHWGPWVALLGVAGIAGPFLSEFFARAQTSLFLQVRTYFTYGVAYEPGGVSAAQQIVYTATLFLALLLCSWACGFVLASLSGRGLWITLLLFYCVVQDIWAIRMIVAGHIILRHGFWLSMLSRLVPFSPGIVAFLLAVALGVRSARKGKLNGKKPLFLAAAGLLLVCLVAWMESWFDAGFARWSGQTYVAAPFVSRIWPLALRAWPIFSLHFVRESREAGTRGGRFA